MSEPPAQNEADAASPRRRRKLSALMVADVSGFSRMMGGDDEGTVERIQDFHRRVQSLVESFHGRVVNTAGDSVLGEFDSVLDAVSCAREIQAKQAEHNRSRPAEERIETRIGVHMGDVIVEDYHVWGEGVNIAARLEPIADPGGICLSEAVYQQVRGRLDLPVQDLGLRELKNIRYPVRIYKLILDSGPDGAEPAVVARATPVGPSTREATLLTDGSWRDELLHPGKLIPLIVAVFLIISPIAAFSTGGAFPTGGTILLAVILGPVWARHTGQRGRKKMALGIAIASGAVWTNWSAVTNWLFLIGGAIVAATGLRRSEDRARERRRDREARRQKKPEDGTG